MNSTSVVLFKWTFLLAGGGAVFPSVSRESSVPLPVSAVRVSSSGSLHVRPSSCFLSFFGAITSKSSPASPRLPAAILRAKEWNVWIAWNAKLSIRSGDEFLPTFLLLHLGSRYFPHFSPSLLMLPRCRLWALIFMLSPYLVKPLIALCSSLWECNDWYIFLNQFFCYYLLRPWPSNVLTVSVQAHSLQVNGFNVA